MMDALSDLVGAARTYALGADRRDKDMWRAVLAADIEISGPGFAISGLEANLGSLDHLAAQFKMTRHIVHDLDARIEGTVAEGETRSTAEHRMAAPDGGEDLLLVWAIRYQDRWRLEGGVWKFTRRQLVVDWEELRRVHDTGGA